VLNTAPAAPVPPEIAQICDVHIMNEIEATMLANQAGLTETDPVAAARGIAKAWGVTTVVTLGEEGAHAFDGDAAWRIGALPVTPVDTTAAGDAFVGVFAATLDHGDDLPTALRRASVAGALACTKEGAQPSLPDADAIDAVLAELPPAKAI
jgi:ribokinase